MRTYTKIVFFSILISLFSVLCPLSAQTSRDWWYTFERGKLMFKQGDYSGALLAFDDARRQRKIMYEQMEGDLIELLSTRDIRRIGDSLESIERYAQDKFYTRAAAALNELYYRIPKESLNNSAAAALTALGTLKDYPEAEQWIGETYLVEGELSLALAQFQKAIAMRDLYENPGNAADLLYKIAEIRSVRQEYNEMERILLSILAGDKLWSGDGDRYDDEATSFARQSMIRTLENNGIDRFLVLYRYNNPETLAAHRQLGNYYYLSGRHARAQEHLMFAFLIQNTVIIDEIIHRRFDFSFTTLEALAAEIDRNPLLAEYAENTEYHKTAYYLATSLHANGKTEAARSIWNFLARQNNAGEWRNRSITQLRSPYVDRALEMP